MRLNEQVVSAEALEGQEATGAAAFVLVVTRHLHVTPRRHDDGRQRRHVGVGVDVERVETK